MSKSIKIYIEPSGTITVFLPKHQLPDRATIERLADTIRELRKSPSANGNSQKGHSPEGQAQNHCTASASLRQEAMEILSRLPAEDAQEITQRAREIIRSRKEGHA